MITVLSESKESDIGDELFTVAEAADAFKITPGWIMMAASQGKFAIVEGMVRHADLMVYTQGREDSLINSESYHEGYRNRIDPNTVDAALVAEICVGISYEQAASATEHTPGSLEKQAIMAARETFGFPLYVEGDAEGALVISLSKIFDDIE